MGLYRLALPNLLSSVLFFQILLWLLSFGLSSACCHPLLPRPLPPRPPEGQIDQTSIFYFGSGLVRLNSNITKFVLLSVLVCEALAPCCVRWPPRRKGRRRDRKPWFRTFFNISDPLELFKRTLVLENFFKRFQVHNQEQEVIEEWLLPKFILRTSYLSTVFTWNMQFSNSPKVHHQIHSISFNYRMHPNQSITHSYDWAL